MTFGQVKTSIEKTLLESYKNPADFKKSLREFKHNVLNNKNFSKIYSIYDQLSSPQNLSETEAREFLSEGIDVIQKLISTIKLPKTNQKVNTNNYSDIDTLVYTNKTNIHERIESKKNIIQTLILKKPNDLTETVNIPIKSMVRIANQTLSNYIENLDENAKREFIQLVSEDNESLKTKFEELKETTLSKLNKIFESENESEIKSKINETIQKVKEEKFDQMSFLKLKSLEQSI